MTIKKSLNLNIPANIIGNKVAIGNSNFSEIIHENFLYADKSLLIKEIIETADKSLLITRPRRWGKTLNMSMLYHFFSATVYKKPTVRLFDKLLISKIDNGKYMDYQGKYPVIFLTFKDVKANSLESIIFKIKLLIKEAFISYEYILQSDKISNSDKKFAYRIIENTEVSADEIEASLRVLAKIIYEYHQQKVYILLDEYDTPLNDAFRSPYLDELIGFMRNLFSNTFKDNSYLEKGIMTGILRISKDSMLSGLNNLETYTVLNKEYAPYFGFTDSELDLLFKNQGLEKNEEAVRDNYNGYKYGDLTVYNPWSIINCLKKNGEIRPYWIHTANDIILRNSLQNANEEIKNKLQDLILGKSITCTVLESVKLTDLDGNRNAIWGLLLYTGHLTLTDIQIDNLNYRCQLKIPNREILALYLDIFIDWLSAGDPNGLREDTIIFMTYLVNGNISEFAKKISNFLLSASSIRDYATAPEAFYHGFMLALSSTLINDYYIYSNKESGQGYPDLMFIAKNNSNSIAVILEFKHVKSKQNAQSIADTALRQINEKSYASALMQHQNITKIIKVGLAFDGKKVDYAYQEVFTGL